MKTFTISHNDAGQRLDKFLKKAMPQLPKNLVYKLVRTKKIKINSARCDISAILNLDDIVSIWVPKEFLHTSAKPEKNIMVTPKLQIVYEDENILVADKPIGVLTQKDTSDCIDSMNDRLLYYLFSSGDYQPNQENSFSPSFLNRLDRNTGGLLLAAKNFPSTQILSEKLRNGELQKFYLCEVIGTPTPSHALLEGWWKKDNSTNQVTISEHKTTNAKPIKTEYRLLSKKTTTSILEVRLHTGKSHQIRAHLAYIGHPLVGDLKYGTTKTNDRRFTAQYLYAYRLIFSFHSDAGILNYLHNKELVSIPSYFKSAVTTNEIR